MLLVHPLHLVILYNADFVLFDLFDNPTFINSSADSISLFWRFLRFGCRRCFQEIYVMGLFFKYFRNFSRINKFSCRKIWGITFERFLNFLTDWFLGFFFQLWDTHPSRSLIVLLDFFNIVESLSFENWSS